MTIRICRICRRLCPMHKSSCAYANAVIYAGLVNAELPVEPYVDVFAFIRMEDEAEDGELTQDSLVVATEDRELFEQLRRAYPQQLRLGVHRIVES